MFPTMGPLWKQMPISRALLGTSFGVPSKGALPPGSPLRAPSLRGVLFPDPFFICLSKSPAYESPSRFTSGAPMERDAHLQSFFYTTFRVPSKGTPLQHPQREMLHFSEFPVNRYFHSASLFVWFKCC